jgi:ABC-type lipoprotein export system ATPase subunit
VAPVLQITNVRKQYHGVRPLRIQALSIDPAERVAVSGLDAGAAEVLVNLVTGASLPDEGEIAVGGQSTRSISDADEWLAWLDRFGIVSPRAVLLDAATLRQNLAMPLTLDIEPVQPEIAVRVDAFAHDAGIDAALLDKPIAALDAQTRARAHLVRAIALDPLLLILEHPTASLPAGDGKRFGETIAQVAGARAIATLIISEDADFSLAAATRRLALHGGTGELRTPRRRLFW